MSGTYNPPARRAGGRDPPRTNWPKHAWPRSSAGTSTPRWRSWTTTRRIDVPAGVFENAAPSRRPSGSRTAGTHGGGASGPGRPLRVRVRCDSSRASSSAWPSRPVLPPRPRRPGGGWNERFASISSRAASACGCRLCLMIGLAVGVQHLPQRGHHPADDGDPLRPRLLPGIHQRGGQAPQRRRRAARVDDAPGRGPGGEPIAGQDDDTTTATVATGLDKVFMVAGGS